MPEPQLSVRGADVRDLAHSLARKEGRSIREVVTDALKAYAARREDEQAQQSTAFWAEFDKLAEEGRRLARTQGNWNESEDDLYDEDGLPA
jgi:hypothetical protein